MNENYGLGWELGNEYINSLRGIMDKYTQQAKVLRNISLDLAAIKADIRRSNNITDDKIRQWYYEDADERLISFESFREQVMDMQQKRLEKLNSDLARVTEEYNSNLSLMIEIKNDTRIVLEEKRQELESILEEKRREMAQIVEQQRSIEVKYDKNGKALNVRNLRALAKKYDELWLDIQKIEHSLQEVREMNDSLELTEEEIALTRTNENEPAINEEDIQLTLTNPTQITQVNEDVEIDVYNMAKEIYDERLLDYEEDLNKLYELQRSYENGEIDYSEYEQHANKMVESYRTIVEEYEIIRQMKEELNSLDMLSVEELNNRLSQLDARYREEYQYRAHGENGLAEHDDNYLENLKEEMSKIQKVLNRKNRNYSDLTEESIKQQLRALQSELEREYQYRAHGESGLIEHDDNYIEDLQTRINGLTEELNHRQKIKEPDIPLQPVMVSQKTHVSDPVVDPSPINETVEEDKELLEYEAAKKEYDALLAMYEDDLFRLYELHQAYEREEIEYSEYEKFADYMVERYRYIIAAYEKVLRMKAEFDLFNSLSMDELNSRLAQYEAALEAEYQYRAHGENGLVEHDDNYLENLQTKINKIKRAINRKNNEFGKFTDDELKQQLARLQSEFEREYHYRAHGENGLIEHEDNYIEDLQRKIKEIKEELKKRGKLEEPIKPEQPMMINKKLVDEPIPPIVDDEEEELETYREIPSILYKITGDYKFSKFDNYLYTHKDIKVFNFQRKKSRTFVDFPLRLFKAGIGTIISGATKYFSKGAYAVLKERRSKIDSLLINIEKLPEEDIDFLIDNLTATNMLSIRGILPDIVFNALNKKMTERIQIKVKLTNLKIETLYVNLINQYKKGLEIKEKLNDNLSLQERENLENEFKSISKNLCLTIRELQTIFKEADKLANAAGRYGMIENYRSIDNNTKGGVNASDKDHDKERILLGAISNNVIESVNKGDGFTAAKYFLFEKKVMIENTKEKRTLKNRFGKASVGAFDNQLFVKYSDYSKDTYFSDVIHTVIIISGIMNAINQIKLKEALNEANAKIAVQNAQIEMLNNQVGDLQTILSKYSTNPEEFIKEYYTFIQNNITQMNANAEWFALHAQAAKNGTAVLKSTGEIYNTLDDAQHIFSGDLTSQLKAIYEDTSLSLIDKTKQMGELLAKGQENMAMVIDTHKAGVMDYLSKFGSVDDFRALEQAVLLAGNSTASYAPTIFNDLIAVANITNNMAALNQLAAIDISVPILPQLNPIIGVIGADVLEDYRNSKNKKEKNEETLEEREQKLEDLIMDTQVDAHELAKAIYEQRKKEWDEKGAFYRLIHKSKKPTMVEAEKEAMERGRSL